MAERSDSRNSPGSPMDPGLTLRFPSVARRIVSQHEQLDTFSALVRSSVERGSLRRARRAFTSFRDALDAHVTMEDQTFFPAIHGLNPALGPDLEPLVGDHADFRLRMDDLHEQLARGSVEEFSRAFDDFCIDFSRHEAREEKIVAHADRATSRSRGSMNLG